MRGVCHSVISKFPFELVSFASSPPVTWAPLPSLCIFHRAVARYALLPSIDLRRPRRLYPLMVSGERVMTRDSGGAIRRVPRRK